LGFGQANNIGIRYAIKHDADFIMLLNQDATLEPDAMQFLLDASNGEALVSPIHLNGDGTRLDHMFKESLLSWKENLLIDHLLTLPHPQTSYPSGEVCAACWLLPVSLINHIGAFNPLFQHYGEDNNFYDRMVYHHIPTIVVPAARMHHDRNIHGNQHVFNAKRLYRDILLEACDINHSFARCCIMWIRRLIQCYVRELPRGDYRPGAFTINMFKCITIIRRIAKSRNQEKRGKAWL
jgi:GT2 family glycosyltransferase